MYRVISVNERIPMMGKVMVCLWDARKVPSFDNYLALNLDSLTKTRKGRNTLRQEDILLGFWIGVHAPTIFGRQIRFIPRFLWPRENLIVDVGRQKVIDYIVNSAPSGFTHCGIGTDNIAPVAGNTVLGAQVDRRSIDNKRRVGTDARMTTFFPSTSPAVGSTIREVAIFDAASGGNMYARTVSPTSFSEFVFSTGASLTVDYTSGW